MMHVLVQRFRRLCHRRCGLEKSAGGIGGAAGVRTGCATGTVRGTCAGLGAFWAQLKNIFLFWLLQWQ